MRHVHRYNALRAIAQIHHTPALLMISIAAASIASEANDRTSQSFVSKISSLSDFSLINSLVRDPHQDAFKPNRRSRQVPSGHFVEVEPMPLPQPELVSFSPALFKELGWGDDLAADPDFVKMFSGDLSTFIRREGWATGYALSIMGQEYYSNCPFGNGNGYGDGRAISVAEIVSKGRRWEFQLKGAGTTPFCRGADGRAVLRSSVREFLVSEAMHHLGVPTSRALCLTVSRGERILRPWYSNGSHSVDPDTVVSEPAAITTRVAPSFLRVGQIELFGRKARKEEHPKALEELEKIVQHTIDREYPLIAANTQWTSAQKVIAFVEEFGHRLSSLMSHWIRVGFCQGNFNSDNCAVGGWTLDYGPFGFVEMYDPEYQMWTGGGQHYSFMHQPTAAVMNFKMLCLAVLPLLEDDASAVSQLNSIFRNFPATMNSSLHSMFALKLGLGSVREDLLDELQRLMVLSPLDYTIFWRELSKLPSRIDGIRCAFYDVGLIRDNYTQVENEWNGWLGRWHGALRAEGRASADVVRGMLAVNPKYIPREWMLVRAYREATDHFDFSILHELQSIFADPYAENNAAVQSKYYKLADASTFKLGGTSHCSCSS